MKLLIDTLDKNKAVEKFNDQQVIISSYNNVNTPNVYNLFTE